jgi:hypothetical protein
VSLTFKFFAMKPNTTNQRGGFYKIAPRHTRANKPQQIKGERNLVKREAIITTVARVTAGGLTVFAQTPEFNIVKPSTTGVPGEEVRVMKFDPAGNFGLPIGFIFGRSWSGDAVG